MVTFTLQSSSHIVNLWTHFTFPKRHSLSNITSFYLICLLITVTYVNHFSASQSTDLSSSFNLTPNPLKIRDDLFHSPQYIIWVHSMAPTFACLELYIYLTFFLIVKLLKSNSTISHFHLCTVRSLDSLPLCSNIYDFKSEGCPFETPGKCDIPFPVDNSTKLTH